MTPDAGSSPRSLRFLGVALFSVLFHLYGIGSPLLDNHYHRQTQTATVARNYHRNGMKFLVPQTDWNGAYRGRSSTEFPLYSWLVGLFWGIFGLGALWGRLLSVLFSAATAAALLAFLERWIDRRAALFSALLFSMIPVEVYFGRTVQPEALALLCTILCFLGLDVYLGASSSGKGAAARAPALAAAWIAGTFAIGLKLPYAYLLGVCAALAWARLGRGALRDPGLPVFFLLTMLGVFSWYKYAGVAAGITPVKDASFLNMLNYSKLPYYAWFQMFSRFPELGVSWPGMALWIAGAWSLRSAAPEVRRLFWCWFACMVVYVVGLGGYVHHHEYTALPWSLVSAAFMGLGLDTLVRRVPSLTVSRRVPARVLLGLLLAGMPLYTAVRIKHWYGINFPFLPEAGRVVAGLSSPEDLFACNERANSLVLFFIDRKGWSEAYAEMGLEPLTWIEEKRLAGAKFFFTQKVGAFADPSDPAARPVRERFAVAHEAKDFIIFRLDRTP